MEDEKDAAVEEWLKGEGFIVATRALRTGGDYLGIETRRGGRAREEVDSIILLEDLEYRQLEKQEAVELIVDELAM
ncbi:hypothetical protein VE04_10133 [Pseudogymnoascus sp. 24MN13]|nr:hypothetical protein VE04_10133 [Pseudogymnoascus sp. 24MN13]